MSSTTLRTIAAAVAVALLAPTAAGAKERQEPRKTAVSGPTVLVGAGRFAGELELAGKSERPVRIVGRGHVGFLDLGGDLEVSCAGKGRVRQKKTEQGTVLLCAGHGRAVARGSHFALRGFARRYRIMLPEGASGTFSGRFKACEQGEAAKGCGSAERSGRPESRDEENAEGEEVPTLAELAAELAGK